MCGDWRLADRDGGCTGPIAPRDIDIDDEERFASSIKYDHGK